MAADDSFGLFGVTGDWQSSGSPVQYQSEVVRKPRRKKTWEIFQPSVRWPDVRVTSKKTGLNFDGHSIENDAGSKISKVKNEISWILGSQVGWERDACTVFI